MHYRGEAARLGGIVAGLLLAAGCGVRAPAAPPPYLPPVPTAVDAAPAPTVDSAGPEAYAPEGGDLADDHEGSGDDEPDDDAMAPFDPSKVPALQLDDATFAKALKEDRASLGPMSIGRPNAGILINGVQMPTGAEWKLVDPARAWGTQETVDAIARIIKKVNEKYANTPPVYIGHLSAEHGGHLNPHKSHQGGRDVDISYYYSTKASWFAKVTPQNFDCMRSWALIKGFSTETNIEFVLVDTSVQKLLRECALNSGEDHELVDKIIQYGSHEARTAVRHIKGHATHLHVRFVSPIARQVGARAEPFFRSQLAKAATPPAPPKEAGPTKDGGKKNGNGKPGKPDPSYIEHRVRDGDTLYRLAQHYGVSVEAIQKANGLKGFALKQKMVLKIPKG
jgi:penicillin-insensitive murein endopeptidase